MTLDPETHAFVAHHVGEEAGIPEALRPRLVGESVSELKADAAALAKSLAPAQERERGPDGRFAPGASGGMSAIIRAMAGRE
jgi:hypothetical protein